MKKYIVINLLLVALSFNSFAQQTSLEDQIAFAKLKIIQYSVKFRADVNNPPIDAKVVLAFEIADLKKFAKKNDAQLKNLNSYIDDWNKETIDVTPSGYKKSLEDFKASIIKDLTSGDTKSGRTKDNNEKIYNDYKDDLDDIISKVSVPKVSEIQANTENDQAKPSDTSVAAKDDQMSSEENPEEQPSIETPKASFSISIILLYILAAISLAGLFLLYRFIQIKMQDQEKKLKSINEGFSMDFKRLQNEVLALKTDNRTTSESILTLKDELSKRINNLAQNNASQQSQQNKVAIAPPAAKPEPVIKYAKYADQGDGFSASELLNEEDNETIFELEMLYPGTAKLRIARNINAQHYALTNATYFLAKVCKYDSVPSNNSSIRTEIPGELKLIGNKWVIVTPAKISFY
jgi:hypothetical protein